MGDLISSRSPDRDDKSEDRPLEDIKGRLAVKRNVFEEVGEWKSLLNHKNQQEGPGSTIRTNPGTEEMWKTLLNHKNQQEGPGSTIRTNPGTEENPKTFLNHKNEEEGPECNHKNAPGTGAVPSNQIPCFENFIN